MSHTAHLLQFFRTDERFIAAVGEFLREGLMKGDTCIAVLAAEHRASVEAKLTEAGMDPSVLSAEYRYIPIDAGTTLAALYDPRTGFDRERFHENLGLLIRQAAARGQPVRLCGEMVQLLIDRGQVTAAIQLEELWNELSRHHNFRLLCMYQASALADHPNYRKLLHSVHSHVLPEEA